MSSVYSPVNTDDSDTADHRLALVALLRFPPQHGASLHPFLSCYNVSLQPTKIIAGEKACFVQPLRR